MNRPRKCDYCKRKTECHKLKTRSPLFDPKKVIKTQSGGGVWKESPVVMFLCNVCFNFFFENQDSNESIDISKIPDLAPIYEKKRRVKI